MTFKLNTFDRIKIVQVYAPHSGRTDVETDDFYDDVTLAINNDHVTHTIVMGDFNAKVGQHLNDEQCTGQYGLGTRNKRGERLVDFASSNQLCVANTFFDKKPTRKWTWLSPDNKTKNEIDYILTSQKRLTQDISFGSNHRMVRAKIHIQRRGARIQNKHKILSTRIQPNLLKDPENRMQYINAVNGASPVTGEPDIDPDIDWMNNLLTCTITNAAQQTIAPKQRTVSKLSSPTRQLIETRRRMLAQGMAVVDRNKINKEVRKAE